MPAGVHGNHTLDMPRNFPPVADSIVDDNPTEGRAVAGKGITAAAEGRAVAGKGISAAAGVKACKAVDNNTHTTRSVPSAALEFAAVSSPPAGKSAAYPQDPVPPLHLGSDTRTQGRSSTPT